MGMSSGPPSTWWAPATSAADPCRVPSGLRFTKTTSPSLVPGELSTRQASIRWLPAAKALIGQLLTDLGHERKGVPLHLVGQLDRRLPRPLDTCRIGLPAGPGGPCSGAAGPQSGMETPGRCSLGQVPSQGS